MDYITDGYVLIPETKAAVTPTGTYIDLTTGQKIIRGIYGDIDGSEAIRLPTSIGYRKYSVPFTLARAHVPTPAGINVYSVSLRFKDGNRRNSDIRNLEWISKSEAIRVKAIERRLAFKKYIGFIDDINNNYYPNATECDKKPGYYYYSGYREPLVVSMSGDVWDLNRGISVVKKLPHGYCSITATTMDGSAKMLNVHRMVAQLFIPIPDRFIGKLTYRDLTVNHMDGVTDNNNFWNLEWMTQGENLRHSIENGSRGFSRVLAKDVRDGEITEYCTREDLARELGITSNDLYVRLTNGESALRTINWRVFKFDDGKPWPDLDEKHKVENRWRVFGKVYRINSDLISSEREVMSRLRITAKELLSIPTDSDVIVSGSNVRIISDPSEEEWYIATNGGKAAVKIASPVQAKNLSTGETTLYDSLTAAATGTNIKKTTLSKYLRKGNEHAILNGFEFHRMTLTD